MFKKLLIWLKKKLQEKPKEINGKKISTMILNENTDPFILLLGRQDFKYRVANTKELYIFLKKYKPKKSIYSVECYGDIKKITERKAAMCKTNNNLIEHVEINPIHGIFKETEILLIEK